MNAGSEATVSAATSHALSIFQQPWWLDATAPNRWGEVAVEEDGQTIARLPYVRKRRLGMTLLTMPPLTQTLGPWIAYDGLSPKARLAAEKRLFTMLIDRLPAHDIFRQALYPSVTNWQPFYWRGFRQTTRYTYIIEDLTDLDAVRRRFESRKQRDIKKASRALGVQHDLPGTRFYDHLTATLARRQLTPTFSRSAFLRVHDACVARDHGQTIGVSDAGGEVHAAVFVVWDADTAYLLVTSIDPKWRDDGSGSLAIWEAIQRAAERCERFNLEGSMIEGVERSYRAFGGSHVPYHVVISASRRARIALATQEIGLAVLNREPWSGL